MLHPGTKISGERTIILEGAELGYEEPVTLENAVLGRRVKVQGGFVKDSVLLDGCEVRQGFHGREGCLLEEDSYFAHNVGLKMTIVFPFVVLGSLINFCDCLLTGGTSRKHHSEVGSGFIHFNFSPRGDKATPSIFGDVPRGVMLNQAPIFLGGLAGVVGPTRIGFGSVLAAGGVYRADYDEDLLVLGERRRDGARVPPARRAGRDPGQGRQERPLPRRARPALGVVSPRTASTGRRRSAGPGGDRRRPHHGRGEHRRAPQTDGSLPRPRAGVPAGDDGRGGRGAAGGKWRQFATGWDAVRPVVKGFRDIEGGVEQREAFCARLQPGSSYTGALQAMSADDRRLGTAWLTSIRSELMDRCRAALPLITA